MKKSISQKGQKHNKKARVVTEEFTGKNLARFGGIGLIRRFLNRYGAEKALEEKVKVGGRRLTIINLR
ncbi:MAG: hypothetical protein SV062_13320 [Thermodesulfobacteriota bacterium]|nr:hypothetical protein [Thermodesulfobacteriota bacterium]